MLLICLSKEELSSTGGERLLAHSDQLAPLLASFSIHQHIPKRDTFLSEIFRWRNDCEAHKILIRK